MTVTPDRDDVLALAADFPPVSWEEWERKVAAVVNRSRAEGQQLEGAEAVASLRSELSGGLTVEPLYTQDAQGQALGLPGAMPFTRGRGPRNPDLPWDVRQLHDNPDATASRRAVLDDLEHGVTSVWVQVGAGGVAPADLAEVLADVQVDLAPVVVSSVTDQVGAAQALLAAWEAKGVDGAQLRGGLGHDPLGAAAVTGASPDLSPLADAVRRCRADLPGVRAITVDTRAYHDAGATDQDEIALAAATALAYLRHLEGEGVTLAEAFAQIDVRLSVDADQFSSIAKIRALRRVWARIGEVLEVPEADRGVAVHAVTSWRMQTRNDPWVNLLRDTLACFGAAGGGADAITVLPFDVALGQDNAFARRVARNTQSLLAFESNIARVADPAGGSWYVEDLTDQLARAAWAYLGELEQAGGLVEALASGGVAQRLAASRAERDQALSTRALPLTGTSTFPLSGEQLPERAPRAAEPAGGLPRRRDGEIFEALRDRSAAHDGGAPSVTVLALGSRRDFGARQTFVSNLLAVAGVEADVVEGADAATVQGLDRVSPVVVLASSAKGYAAHAAEVTDALRARDEVHRVVLAGRAAEAEGVTLDGEVRDGIDVVAWLSELLDDLGVAALPADATTEGDLA